MVWVPAMVFQSTREMTLCKSSPCMLFIHSTQWVLTFLGLRSFLWCEIFLLKLRKFQANWDKVATPVLLLIHFILYHLFLGSLMHSTDFKHQQVLSHPFCLSFSPTGSSLSVWWTHSLRWTTVIFTWACRVQGSHPSICHPTPLAFPTAVSGTTANLTAHTATNEWS